jgi:hypothetical protein
MGVKFREVAKSRAEQMAISIQRLCAIYCSSFPDSSAASNRGTSAA